MVIGFTVQEISGYKKCEKEESQVYNNPAYPQILPCSSKAKLYTIKEGVSFFKPWSPKHCKHDGCIFITPSVCA